MPLAVGEWWGSATGERLAGKSETRAVNCLDFPSDGRGCPVQRLDYGYAPPSFAWSSERLMALAAANPRSMRLLAAVS